MIFSNLNLNSTEPIYYQIEQHIKKTIENGILSSNSKLPATRELAKIIGVSRNSVITAYENLEIIARLRGNYNPLNVKMVLEMVIIHI